MTLIRGGLAAGLLPRVEVSFHLRVKSSENLKEFAGKFVGKRCRDCIKRYRGRGWREREREGTGESFIVTFLRSAT